MIETGGDAIGPTAKPAAGPRAQGLGIALVGFSIAAWSAMCGIGGGLFAVPVLHYVYKLSLKDSVVTSLSLVAAATISATLSEMFRDDSAIDWGIVAGLAAGCLVGAPIGFRVARRIETRPLKMVFIVILVLVAARIFGFIGTAHAASPDGLLLPGIGGMDYVVAVCVGLGGGFVAPLLGIGGGLVAVPALLFTVPVLGHLGARACSMAMATVTSTRSLAMYYKAGELDLRRSASFAGGAAVGAIVGVQLVHLENVTDAAQKMLGATLLIVAARFVWDVRKKPATESGD